MSKIKVFDKRHNMTVVRLLIIFAFDKVDFVKYCTFYIFAFCLFYERKLDFCSWIFFVKHFVKTESLI